MNRVYNFSAGPSMLPESVLLRAAAEMLDYEGSGQSVMEMSHRSKVYDAIIKGAESLLREVMEIPDNYKVLFLQGGASSQFAMVPLNLMTKNRKADYVLSGQFSTKAYKEAARFGDCKVVASSKEQNFSRIPDLDPKEFRPDADYFHICMNNTIYGTVFHALPETGDVPLVADISSCILSRPIDVSRFGVLYAGAQKNVAPAGLTIVIIREDLIGEPQEKTPTMFMYKTHAESDSMYNTPPCYSIYMCKLVLEWLKNEVGGLKAMEKRNVEKAALRCDNPWHRGVRQWQRQGGALPFPERGAYRNARAGRKSEGGDHQRHRRFIECAQRGFDGFRNSRHGRGWRGVRGCGTGRYLRVGGNLLLWAECVCVRGICDDQ